MSARNNKKRLYSLWFQSNSYPRQTAEDHAWLNMAPVGREFGSADYDRLMQEDEQARLEWNFPIEERVAKIRLKRKEKEQQKI
jgi:hypothetical protein